MNILGIGLSHGAGVCLIQDDRIVFAQEEDRFSRRRRHRGWPERSLAHLMEKFELEEGDIDLLVLCDEQSVTHAARPFGAKEVTTVHHHLAHILSGWALTGWDDFDSISLDGGGDNSWQSFARVQNREVAEWRSNCGSALKGREVVRGSRWRRVRTGTPFGTYWSRPAVLNFGMVDRNGVGGYEGKLMGLAAHGRADGFRPDDVGYTGRFAVRKSAGWHWVTTSGESKVGDPEACVTHEGRYSLEEVRAMRKTGRIVSEYDLAEEHDRTFAANFGAYLQACTNEVTLECFERNFSSDVPVVVSGGIFANVVLNGLLNQRYEIFVVPPMGDEGLALGAAAWGAYLKGIRNLACDTLFLGYNAGSNEGVDSREVAQRLADEQVVGLIEGKMELGPRALGARSILSDPQDRNVNQTINERLGRVEYMPFAPVILRDRAAEILEGWDPSHRSSQHMTLTYPVKDEWRDRLRGVVHVDGTVRPQVIERGNNPVYYDILVEYARITGIPALINTSFNAHGEPILRTVEEGRAALDSRRVDALVAGNRIFEMGEKPACSPDAEGGGRQL